MKNSKKLLSKLLTVILSTMMIFSSILVVKNNIVLAQENPQEETEEVVEQLPAEEEEEKSKEAAEAKEDETTIPEEIIEEEIEVDAEKSSESQEATTEETEEVKQEDKAFTKISKEAQTPAILGTMAPSVKSSPMMVGGILAKLFNKKSTYKVTFISNGREWTPSNASSYENIEADATIVAPEGDTGDGKVYGWYVREYTLLGTIKSEERWNFSSDIVTGNLTLYAKYLKTKADGTYKDEDFDFKVKHVDSKDVSDEEFLANHTTGQFTQRNDDGYLYSYYSYYNKDRHNTLLSKLGNLLDTTADFTDAQVEKYDYITRKDQISYEIVTNIKNIDSTIKDSEIKVGHEGIIDIDSEEYSEYTGKEYKIVALDVSIEGTEQKGTEIRIGNYYSGTAFDLAIQEANEGDVITLMNNLYIGQPIQIWGNVNFDLGKNSILFNENSGNLELLHFMDKFRTADIIVPGEIRAAILVTSAKTTISNGTIYNYDGKGRGIVDISFDEYYSATLEDLTIDVDSSSNTNKNAVEAGYYLLDNKGNLIEKSSGYIDVINGNYEGYFKNNNNGYIKLYSGVHAKYDPKTYNMEGEEVTTVDYCQFWDDYDGGTSTYKYSVDIESEASVKSGNNTKQYRTLKDAINSTNNTTGKTVILSKDLDLKNCSYATESMLQLDSNGTYTFDTNGKTITGSEIDVTNGNVTFTGAGYIKTSLYTTENGKATITDGHYYTIYDFTESQNSLVVYGGNFNERMKANYIAPGYVIIGNEVPVFKFSVVLADDDQSVTVTINGESTNVRSFNEAINMINQTSTHTTRPNIRLNKDVLLISSIKITKPLDIDLGGNKIISTVDYNAEDLIGYTSIFIDLNGNDTVNISNGTIINNSIAGNADTVYGIYVKNGSLKLKDIIVEMAPSNCKTVSALYNNSLYSTVELDNSWLYMKDSVKTYDKVTFITNKGTMIIGNWSEIDAEINSDCTEVTAVMNSGDLTIKEYAMVSAVAKSGYSATAYGVYSTGNVYVTDNGSVLVNNNYGDSYGIYQGQVIDINYIMGQKNAVKGGAERVIELSEGGNISVVLDKSQPSSITCGIYTEEDKTSYSARTNVLLGKSKIVVNSHNKAVGVYSAGGYVIAGTRASDHKVNNGLFDQVKSDSTVEYAHEDIYTEGFDRFARIIIDQGGDRSVGIDCEYGTESSIPNQLFNTVIELKNVTGVNSYCVTASNSIVGTDLIGGYYKSSVKNRMLDGRVFAKKGFFTNDVRLNAAKKFECVKTTAEDIYRDFENTTYEYKIDGSNCKMYVDVFPENELTLKVIIEFDEVMLSEPDKYGATIVLDCMDRTINESYTISDLKLGGQNAGNRFVRTFKVPIKTMCDNIAVQIVGFDEDKVANKVIHSVSKYSIKDYYIGILSSKDDDITQEVRDLSISMLNLGAAAQEKFGYYGAKNDQPLVNVDIKNKAFMNWETDERYSTDRIHASELSDGTIEPYEEYSENFYNIIDPNSIKYSLLLESTTTIRFYFNLLNNEGVDQDIKKYSVFRVDDEIETPLDVLYSEDENKYYIDITGINIKQVMDVYQINLVYNGTVHYVKYSPIDYILTASKDNGLLGKLMDAYYICYLMACNFYYE